jgi:alkanesulfonate monooxygenase SsuD/methylene tetrahydromethanopterin reductase-like flavin-dependent oxidoreductase (luciferase family)
VSAVIVDGVVPRLVAGSPETVATQLPSILEAAGADEIVLLAALVDPAAHRYCHEQLQLIATAIPGPEVHAAASGRSCDPSLAGRPTREGTP